MTYKHMTKEDLQQTEKIIKDLILFDSAWKKRKKIRDKLSNRELEKIEIYRDLVKNSFFDLITKIYPLTNKLLKKDWDKLIPQYIESYPPSSPMLNKVAENFPFFLAEQKKIVKKYPFIHELALYEWLEVGIYEQSNKLAERQTGTFILNPVHEICSFEYPIPEIAEKLETSKFSGKATKQKSSVLIYRDPKTLKVRFNEISSGTLAYLELLKSDFPHEMILMILAEHYKIEEKNLKDFYKQINVMVKTLKERKILVHPTNHIIPEYK